MRILWVGTSVHSAKASVRSIHPAVIDMWLLDHVDNPDDVEWVYAGPDMDPASINGAYAFIVVDAPVPNELVEELMARTGFLWKAAPRG